VPAFDRALELSYGENPNQAAAYYAERGARTHLLSFVEQLGGKPLLQQPERPPCAAVAAELDGPAA
jgi:AICAR transformylase/IMP cyclohydrolase PurH